MNGPVSKLARCAIYTRKSTEYNLALAFNSLDAQREACEAYIKSQAHEGWRLIPGRYDDGAFSGASLDRPALQQLLADVRAGKIDIVLVYKVDRLTRSLADFAKLIELFDVHGVSFVSVTQSFNTSSSMGRLTYLLKNRFYIGELVYRGEVHHGEHEPILDSALFEAVGAKLAAQAVERRCRLRGLPAILSGRLFDHRGNRMSPTHANKRGARYRYYVSQAVLQGKPPPPGLVSRVPAAEIEAFVVAALRNHLNARGGGERLPDNDRDLLERHLERVTLTPNHLELRLRELVEPTQAHDPVNDGSSGPPIANVTTITVLWSSPVSAAVKGIIHVPAHNTPIKAWRREAALIAIAQCSEWIDGCVHGRAARFAVIARREGKAERHIRLLAPLAFVSPRIVSALLDGTAPADLTLTKLARALPYCWAQQERRVGTSAPFHG